MQLNYILLSFLNSALTIFGQVLWKLGLMKPSGYSLKLFYNPLILSGVMVYGMSTVLWLFILSKVPFSVAYPLNSFAYVLSVLVGFFIFKESLSIQKLIGILLIIGGVVFITKA